MFFQNMDELFEQKIEMLGLKYVGKTKILHKLLIWETLETISKIGINVKN